MKVGDWAAETGETVLVTLGLGSCVAILLYDAAARVGGLAHVLLPSPALARDRANPGKFPETAVPALIERLAALGANRGRLRARLVGGAGMFGDLRAASTPHMGERNVQASRGALQAARIPLDAEDTGGDYGRSVYFFLADGRVEVRSVSHGSRTL